MQKVAKVAAQPWGSLTIPGSLAVPRLFDKWTLRYRTIYPRSTTRTDLPFKRKLLLEEFWFLCQSVISGLMIRKPFLNSAVVYLRVLHLLENKYRAKRVHITCNIVRLFGHFVILYCKNACLTSQLRALRFFIRFAFPRLWEMGRNI